MIGQEIGLENKTEEKTTYPLERAVVVKNFVAEIGFVTIRHDVGVVFPTRDEHQSANTVRRDGGDAPRTQPKGGHVDGYHGRIVTPLWKELGQREHVGGVSAAAGPSTVHAFVVH